MPVKVLRSYLMKRQMVVRHKGETSAIMSLPGSCGQGTNLGILSYLVNIDSCGLPMDDIVKYVLRKCNMKDRRAFSYSACASSPTALPPYHITESAARLKYIDNLTLCQTVNLIGLENMPEESERPLNYRDRIRRRTNFKKTLMMLKNSAAFRRM